ncbi:MAG: twin-arginine translocase TatA/TatE family subunit [Gracilibacteraceae bacterium]|jgi:sec-independent protein translocase protein TatB|nr:twin-arginine translocase TatA/TatE family subunit [Gracilibacteraceae bacterium]
MSFTEIALIVFVALIVFGPEDLPAIARSLGKMVYQARRIWNSLTSEVKNVWETPAELWNEQVKEPLETARSVMSGRAAPGKSTAAARPNSSEPAPEADLLLSYDDLVPPPPAENPLAALPPGLVSGLAKEDEKTD